MHVSASVRIICHRFSSKSGIICVKVFLICLLHRKCSDNFPISCFMVLMVISVAILNVTKSLMMYARKALPCFNKGLLHCLDNSSKYKMSNINCKSNRCTMSLLFLLQSSTVADLFPPVYTVCHVSDFMD